MKAQEVGFDLDRYLKETAAYLLRNSHLILEHYCSTLIREISPDRIFYKRLSFDEFLDIMYAMLRSEDVDQFVVLENQKTLFRNDPIQEIAIRFFITECFPRKGKKLRNIGYIDIQKYKSIGKLSIYLYLLSICYSNFHNIQSQLQKMYKTEKHEAYINLDRLKEMIFERYGQITAYYPLKYEKKRWSSIGGKMQKRLPGILLAVKQMIQDYNLKSYSAEFLWSIFKKRHKGQNNALIINDFKIYFDYESNNGDKEKLFQLSSDGITKSIGSSAFKGYVKKVKDNLKN